MAQAEAKLCDTVSREPDNALALNAIGPRVLSHVGPRGSVGPSWRRRLTRSATRPTCTSGGQWPRRGVAGTRQPGRSNRAKPNACSVVCWWGARTRPPDRTVLRSVNLAEMLQDQGGNLVGPSGCTAGRWRGTRHDSGPTTRTHRPRSTTRIPLVPRYGYPGYDAPRAKGAV